MKGGTLVLTGVHLLSSVHHLPAFDPHTIHGLELIFSHFSKVRFIYRELQLQEMCSLHIYEQEKYEQHWQTSIRVTKSETVHVGPTVNYIGQFIMALNLLISY
jgi:hypothetical protein